MKTIYLHSEEEINRRKSRKIVKKIKKKYEVNNVAVALSRSLDNNLELINELEQNKIKILNGRWLFKFLLNEAIEYITKTNNKNLSTQSIAFMLNENDDTITEQIINIAKKAKMIKIVSKNLNSFKYLETKLYNDYGIAIQLTNNKTKSLLKTEIIINVDFEEENLKNYSLNPHATLVNVKKTMTYFTKFKGININNYKIDYDKNNFEELESAIYFEKNILYESYIYRKDTFSNIHMQLKQDNVRLICLS